MFYSYDASETHLPALVRAVMKLGGPVLELGGGWHSSPILHALDIDVLTLEEDAEWVDPLREACGGNFIHAPDYVAAMRSALPVKPWKIIFIDCHGQYRLEATRLFSRFPLLVVHDTNLNEWIQWEVDVFPQFVSVKHWTQRHPWTSYLSNILDVNTI